MIEAFLHRPHRIFSLTFLCVIASVLGGYIGYAIGAHIFTLWGDTILSYLGYTTQFEHIRAVFLSWGVWIIILKGLTPIPYKLIALTAGVMHLDIWDFGLASLLSRSVRFYALALSIRWAGPRMKHYIQQWLWPLCFVCIIGMLAYGFFLKI